MSEKRTWIIVGAGGLLYHSLPALAVYAGERVLTVDPDIVEEGNAGRQWPGGRGWGKALLAGKALGELAGCTEVRPVSVEAEKDEVAMWLGMEGSRPGKKVGVVCLPDNDKARMGCVAGFRRAGVPDAVAILAGNNVQGGWVAGTRTDEKGRLVWNPVRALGIGRQQARGERRPCGWNQQSLEGNARTAGLVAQALAAMVEGGAPCCYGEWELGEEKELGRQDRWLWQVGPQVPGFHKEGE